MNRKKCAVDIPERLTYLGYGFQKNSNGYISVDKQIPRPAVHYNWSSSTPKKSSRQITVLSDGILSKKDFALRFVSENGKYDIPVYGCDNINVYSDVVFDSNCASHALSFQSSDLDICRVNRSTGELTPKKAGTVTITVKTYNHISATCKVVVS